MNKTTTIRVSRELYDVIKFLAKRDNENIQDVIKHAISEYKKRKFFEEMNAAFKKLRENKQDWDNECKEREVWDITIADGLEEGNGNK